MQFLEADLFKMIVSGNDDLVLLGKRSNRPVIGSWFVSGGRIFKDEIIPALVNGGGSLAYNLGNGNGFSIHQVIDAPMEKVVEHAWRWECSRTH